jgi:hypothetical protein
MTELTVQGKIAALAGLVLADSRERLAREASQEQGDALTVRVVDGKKYAKVDRDRGCAYLMVEYATGNIYGTKGYGQADTRYFYGTLDTIGEWNWGGYGPKPRKENVQVTAGPLVAHDLTTLAVIGRNPGITRKHYAVSAAAAGRLVRAGLVSPPDARGRLYLTEAGTEAHWGPFPVRDAE